MDYGSCVLLGSLEGRSLQAEEFEFFAEESPTGLTLFARNIDPQEHKHLLSLVSQLQSERAAHSPPMIVAIDQEGGRVARLKAPFPNRGPALTLEEGRCDSRALEAIEIYGSAVGARLKELGVNVNFAPVLDVLSERSHDAIGDRSFGKDPGSVTLRAGAFLQGLQGAGVAGCLKHFPGQGMAEVDTHEGAAIIDKSLAELADWELEPFRALVKMAPMVMVNHCIYPQIDTEHEATLSQKIIGEVLRNRLGFKGLVVSDDMTMGAITGRSQENQDAWCASIVEAIACGNDLVTICQGLQRWKAALAAVRSEAKSSLIFRKRLQEAAEAVLTFRRKWC